MTAVGRPRKQSDARKNRKLTLSDEVFNGLKKIGNGSASQAVSDLYYEKKNHLQVTSSQTESPHLRNALKSDVVMVQASFNV